MAGTVQGKTKVQPARTTALTPATSNAVSPTAAALLDAILAGSLVTPAAPAAAAVINAKAAPKKTLFEQFFGVDLTSAMFVLAGILVSYLAVSMLYSSAVRQTVAAIDPDTAMRLAKAAAKTAAAA